MTMSAAARSVSRRVFGFVKTTFVGGLVFLAPLVIVVVLAVKLGSLLKRLARPVVAVLPVETVLGVLVADVIVIALLILACFIGGLLARVSLANRFIKKAEAQVLWRIPVYGFLKSL